MQPDYTIKLIDRKCEKCKNIMTHLFNKDIPHDDPEFVICWTCQTVCQVGKGRITK